MVRSVLSLKTFLTVALADPEVTGMWFFDARVAELRKRNNFVVGIADHPDSEIASRRTGTVLSDSNPPTHPMPSSVLANVTVKIEIAKKNETRIESLPVHTLKVSGPKAKKRHAVIRGEHIGAVVVYIKSAGADDAYVYMEDNPSEKTYLKKADICQLVAL